MKEEKRENKLAIKSFPKTLGVFYRGRKGVRNGDRRHGNSLSLVCIITIQDEEEIQWRDPVVG
jgi:hypothetical protein